MDQQNLSGISRFPSLEFDAFKIAVLTATRAIVVFRENNGRSRLRAKAVRYWAMRTAAERRWIRLSFSLRMTRK
jgi:hypothetical protein